MRLTFLQHKIIKINSICYTYVMYNSHEVISVLKIEQNKSRGLTGFIKQFIHQATSYLATRWVL